MRSIPFVLVGFAWALLLVPSARSADEPAEENAELILQTPHSGDVTASAFSPDGKIIATAGLDTTAKLWHTESGRELHTMMTQAPILALAFSRDGKMLATGGQGTAVRVWEVATGKHIRGRGLEGGAVQALVFAPDDRTVLAGCERRLHIWSPEHASKREQNTPINLVGVTALAMGPKEEIAAAHGKEVRILHGGTGKIGQTLSGHTDRIIALAYDAKGLLASGSEDKTIRLWKPGATASHLTLTGHSGAVTGLAFSPDGKYLVSGSSDRSARFWDAASGKLLGELKDSGHEIRTLAHHPTRPIILTAGKGAPPRLWSIDTEKFKAVPFGELTGPLDKVHSIDVSQDGNSVIVGMGHTTNVWHPGAAVQLQVLRRVVDRTEVIALRPDGTMLAGMGGRRDGVLQFWSTQGLKVLGQIPRPRGTEILALAFSPDGKQLASADSDHHIRIWDVPDPKPRGIKTITKPRNIIDTPDETLLALVYSPDNKILAAATRDKDDHGFVRFWDTVEQKEIQKIALDTARVTCLAFSADGKLIAGGGEHGTIRIWDPQTGKWLRALNIKDGRAIYALSFAPDADRSILVSGGADGMVRVWDHTTGKEQGKPHRHGRPVRALTFADKGRLLFTASGDGLAGEKGDGTVKIWTWASKKEDRLAGRELCTLISFDDGSWAVADPSGRYDASNGGDVDWLHWTVKNEPIALNQLKERYYEPDLLAKVLGLNKEPVRKVAPLDDLKLPPGVEVTAINPKKKTVNVRLTNKGGNLGRVQVFVNDKEVTTSIPKRVNPRADKEEITLDLSHERTFRGKGDRIRVVAWNGDETLSSRGLSRELDPDGAVAASPPELWAIIVGVSSYKDKSLNLLYPSKDAEDVDRALKAGAKRLFKAEHVHITLLSSSADAKQPDKQPTKANIEKAFAKARQAKPDDVFLVYFAGHGVALTEPDVYCYLTADTAVRNAQAFADPKVRQTMAVSSDELVDWIKQVPALKQVMVLDTCASGAVSDKLVLADRRELPSGQARAIERLKDRTGFHILMGCAADRVSYEATRFQQGLLTYAVLEGIKTKEALDKKDLLDVTLLFRHAAHRVPELAQDIGGIQQPLVSSPHGGTVNVGQYATDDDLREVPLSSPRPMLLRPRLSNPTTGDDDLKLESSVRDKLKECYATTVRGRQTGADYLDVEAMPGGIRPVGTYTINGTKITVKLALRQDGKEVASLTEIPGDKNKLDDLAARIAAAIADAANKQKVAKD